MADTSDQANPTSILKLLSGLQSGAEVALGDGDYLIGSHDECDIVLLDDSVAQQHVLLTIDGDQLQLTAKDHTVAIGAHELACDESTDLPIPTVIGLGTTFIGLGTVETDWLNVPLPQANDRSDSTSTEPLFGRPDVAPMHAQEEEATASPKARHASSWVAIGALAAVALAAVFFGQDIMAWMNTKEESKATAPVSLLAETKATIAALDMPAVKAIQDSRGNIELNGYSSTKASKQGLLDALKAADITVISHIRTVDGLTKGVRETLDSLQAQQVDFSYLGEGGIQLQGYLGADISERQLISILQQDIPGIRRIQSTVRTLDDSAADLRQRLNSAGLSSRVTINAEHEQLVASGELDARLEVIWQGVMRAFNDATQGVPLLLSQVTVLDDEPIVRAIKSVPETAVEDHQPLSLKVRGIVIGQGKAPYALLENGLRVSKGDVVGNSYVVEAVNMNNIEVRNGSQSFVYYIGEGS